MSLTAMSLIEYGEKKIIHEHDVHHVYKVGFKRFWAKEAKMSLTALTCSNRREENFSRTGRTSSLESRNQSFLCSRCRIESNSHELARIRRKEN